MTIQLPIDIAGHRNTEGKLTQILRQYETPVTAISKGKFIDSPIGPDLETLARQAYECPFIYGYEPHGYQDPLATFTAGLQSGQVLTTFLFTNERMAFGLSHETTRHLSIFIQALFVNHPLIHEVVVPAPVDPAGNAMLWTLVDSSTSIVRRVNTGLDVPS